MHLLLVGPGRIGAALRPLLQAAGHTVTVRTRASYGDFLLPSFHPEAVVDQVEDCDAALLLAGLFELHADEVRMRQANAIAPLRLAEAIHQRFPQAQMIAFLDARIGRPIATLSPAIQPYMEAKNQLAQWVTTTARLWGRASGTRVNAIAPGPVLPPPNKAHSEKAGECLTPRPTLQDLFNAVDFLLKTPSVTGQILYVAAGQQVL